MNKNLLTLLFSLFSLAIIGQENYLTPCTDLSNKIYQIKKYKESFEKIINTYFDEDYLVRFIAQPSFNPEYAFQIRVMNKTTYEIKVILLQENYWASRNRDSVQVNAFNRIMDNELALQIDKLFKKATDSVNQRKAEGFGLDGDTYYFLKQSENGIKCGETWSPNIHSPLAKLVNVCKDLIQYSLGNTMDLIKIKEEIVKLYEKIE